MRLRVDTIVSPALQEMLEMPEVDWGLLGELFADTCAARGLADRATVDLSLSFVSKEEIQRLNAQYRNIDAPTDVLSFPLWEDDGCFAPPIGWLDLPLGDVVVSPEYVLERDGEDAFYSEIILMIVHGTLHLIGFDHDTEEREREMWSLQEGIRDRYVTANATRKIEEGL